MEIDNENRKAFGNGRKLMKLWIITLQFNLKKQNKQTKKQNDLLTLTVSCKKRSCLIRSEKKKTATKIIAAIIIVIITITIIIVIKEKRKENKIKELIKMTMEAIVLMIS